MYNYQAAPGQYGRPPPYGAPPGMAPPPGMGAPPGLPSSAPGVAPAAGPPGMAASSSPIRPGLPPNFQPPGNLPNINFNAPVIRLGTSGAGRGDMGMGKKDANADAFSRNRAGLGMGADRGGDHDRKQARENMTMMQPPTREEVARTIFIGGIPDVISNESVERIANCAGSLRRWTRASNSSGRIQRFGFAEYEDAESLETAIEILGQGIKVPAKKVDVSTEDGEVETTNLVVSIDDNSRKYSEEWKAKRNENPDAASFRVDSAQEELRNVLASLFRPSTTIDAEGDVSMQDAEMKQDPLTGEVVTIPFTAEDELSDIPAEMRETVAAEIANFRERSNRKDLERLKLEEEREAAERRTSAPRANRLASPPSSAPTGPAGGANGIPLGPRNDRGVQGAPSGPKGLQGSQMPKDYQNGVTFVNGNNIDINWIRLLDDDDTDASDDELERRRREKIETEQEKTYLDHERRWLNRERNKVAAADRLKNQEEQKKNQLEKHKRELAERLKKWNDDEEGSRKAEEYYQDRSLWVRKREKFRAAEADADERDRLQEEREKARDKESKEPARGIETGARQAEREAPREPARFKLSLGAAVQSKAQQNVPVRRTAAEVEGLLEDEEESSGQAKRELIPIKFDSAADMAGLSDEERREAAARLAQEIPTDTEGLWNWPVSWDFVGEDVLERLRPLVEKKIMEYLGVQEQMLVDVVEEHIRKRGSAKELVVELEGALDEEAEALVKKLWRILIFFSESEKKGLST